MESHVVRPIFILLLLGFTLGLKADDLSVIRQKYIESILYKNKSEQQLIRLMCQRSHEKVVGDQMVVELMERCPIEVGHVRQLLSDLSEQGSWSGLDFTNSKAASWLPRIHAARMLELAKVYANSEHTFYKSAEIAEAIHKAMGYWFRMKPVAANWWYNEIGIPKVLGAAFVLFEDQLSMEEKKYAIEVMNQAKIGMTAQNRVWLAGNVLVKGLLLNDIQLVREARNAMNDEIKMAYGKAEGIKVDYSFHQHGPQQQVGNYGAAYLATMSFWAYILDGTSLALDQERFKLITNYTNEGVRRILWKNKMDVNNLGRQLYRQAQWNKAFSSLFSANALAQVNSKDRNVYLSLIHI